MKKIILISLILNFILTYSIISQSLNKPFADTCISSDYGPRNKNNYPSVNYDFHKGIDYAQGAGTDIIAIDSGTVDGIVGDHNKYKNIIVKSNANPERTMTYLHIFNREENKGLNYFDRLGDYYLLKCVGNTRKYAILNTSTGKAFSKSGTDSVYYITSRIDSGKTVYDTTVYKTTNKVEVGDKIAPVGNSSPNDKTLPYHLHLILKINGNDANPFSCVQHNQPKYTITFENTPKELSRYAAEYLKYKVEMQDADAYGAVGSQRYTNVAMDIDSFQIFINPYHARSYEYDSTTLIRGPSYMSKFSYGGRAGTTIYPQNVDDGEHKHIGDANHTGVEPHAYNDHPYEYFWFSDFVKNIRSGDVISDKRVDSARCTLEARYPDGRYQIRGKLTTILDSVYFSNGNKLIIDNFHPFVKEVQIGCGDDLYYHSTLKWDSLNSRFYTDPNDETDRVIQSVDLKSDIQFKFTFSEQMDSVWVDSLQLIRTQTNWHVFPTHPDSVSRDSTVWYFHIPKDSIGLDTLVDTRVRLVIGGRDLAQNVITNNPPQLNPGEVFPAGAGRVHDFFIGGMTVALVVDNSCFTNLWPEPNWNAIRNYEFSRIRDDLIQTKCKGLAGNAQDECIQKCILMADSTADSNLVSYRNFYWGNGYKQYNFIRQSKEIGRMIVDILRPGDKIMILTAGNGTQVVLEPTLITNDSVRHSIQDKIDAISPGAWSNPDWFYGFPNPDLVPRMMNRDSLPRQTSSIPALRQASTMLDNADRTEVPRGILFLSNTYSGQSTPKTLTNYALNNLPGISPKCVLNYLDVIPNSFPIFGHGSAFNAFPIRQMEKTMAYYDRQRFVGSEMFDQPMLNRASLYWLLFPMSNTAYNQQMLFAVDTTMRMPQSARSILFTVQADAGCRLLQFNIGWMSAENKFELRITSPSGLIMDSATVSHENLCDYWTGNTFAALRVLKPEPGRWQAEVVPVEQNTDASISLFVSGKSALNCQPDIPAAIQPGEPILFKVRIRNMSQPVSDCAVSGTLSLPSAGMFPPDVLPLELKDDGSGGDEMAGDGIYTAVLENVDIPGAAPWSLNINGNDEEVGAFHRRLSGQVYIQWPPEVACSADSLRFGAAVVQETEEKTLYVNNVSFNPLAIPLKITGVSTHSTVFSANVDAAQLLPGENLKLSIQFTPVDTVTYRDTLQIMSNSLYQPIIHIPLSGFGIQSPALVVNRDSVSVRLVEQDSADVKIPVSNTGRGELIWQGYVQPPENRNSRSFSGGAIMEQWEIGPSEATAIDAGNGQILYLNQNSADGSANLWQLNPESADLQPIWNYAHPIQDFIASGNEYTVLHEDGKIIRLAGDGTVLDSLQVLGTYPRCLSKDGSTFWVMSDIGTNSYVHQYTLSGNLLQIYPLPAGYRPVDVASGAGKLWMLLDEYGSNPMISSWTVGDSALVPSASFELTLSDMPMALAHDGQNLYVSDYASHLYRLDDGIKDLADELKLSGVILPDETDTLHLRFFRHMLPDGEYRSNIVIHSNDPEHARVSIPLSVLTAQPYYTVHITAGAGGLVQPADSVMVNCGDSLRITLVPNAGFEVSDLIIDSDTLDPVTHYTLRNIYADHQVHAEFSLITELPDAKQLPRTFALLPITPNPFNPTARIVYTVAKISQVKLIVYNILGERVAVLLNEYKNPGKYTMQWDAGNLPSGIYVVRMEAGNFVRARKCVLIK